MTDTTGRRTTGKLLASRAANTLRYSLMNIFVLIGTGLMAYGGGWTWGGFLLSFILIGYVDELLGDVGDKELMPPVWYMQLMLYLTLPLLVLLTLVCCNTITHNGFPPLDALSRALGFDPEAARARTDWLGVQGAVVSLGMFYGMAGVNVAHELVHRTDKPIDLVIGRWLLAFTWDTGFGIEHVYGHHRNVATELDPATARRGEYIVPFIFRSTVGQIGAAYRVEKQRLKRKGIPDRLWTNRFWRGQLMTLAVIALYVTLLGPIGILVSFYVAVIGKAYLEVVNYIKHRLVRIPGEPVEARHSWDSYRRVSGGMLYNLPLHAHHHRVATRRYWQLQQSLGEAPVLPYGYMGSILLAFVPGLWPKLSRPLLTDWDTRLASAAERAYLKAKGTLLG